MNHKTLISLNYFRNRLLDNSVLRKLRYALDDFEKLKNNNYHNLGNEHTIKALLIEISRIDRETYYLCKNLIDDTKEKSIFTKKLEKLFKIVVEYTKHIPKQQEREEPPKTNVSIDKLIPRLKSKENLRISFSTAGESIGAALKAARKEAGMTQAAVAEKMGTQDSAIRRLESGKHKSNIETLEKYANAIGLEIELSLAPPKH